MHEMGLAQNILDVVLRSAQENQVKKVLRITMRAGQLRAIVPEQLKFCFGFVAKDSLADGAELVIHVVPIQARCKGCHTEFLVQEFQFTCPECANGDLDILQGKELLVENIEVS